MKTIVEELIEIVEHEANGAIDTLRHVTALGHIERVLTDAAERIRDLETANAALAKRVAELELQCGAAAEQCHKLCNEIDKLQSQLAWTPVSAGLPTEPGVYAFGVAGDKSVVVIWSLSHAGNTHRWWFAGRNYVSPLDVHHDVTHYRRIELQEAT